MIDTRQISFNEVKPPNVRVNLLPNHGSSSGPSVNMISIVAIEEEEDAQKTSIPFVINCAPAEVAFAAVPFIIEVLAKEPYQDSRVPWTYEGEAANAELEMSAIGITRSSRVYQGLEPADKGKAPAVTSSTTSEAAPLRAKKVTEQEVETFMKVIKASEYKVIEQMGKSPAHISLLVLLLSSELHRNALLKVLTATQVPKDTAPNRIEETVDSIFSNQISFVDDELPSEGQGHLRALFIVCKCNNHIVGRVIIDNGSALNPLAREAMDSCHRCCSFIAALEVEVLCRRQAHHRQRQGRLRSLQETAIPYISIGEDHNLPFHSFDTISVIRDYGEVCPSRTDCMIRKIMGGTSDSPITESDDFSLDAVEAFLALPAIYAVTEETSSKIQMAEEDKIKTTFITMWGTFCYKVMPFGLKNAGATYQQAMVTLFHDMMHKEIEVYVDDMIAKSKEGEDHLVNLKRLFDCLRKYKLRLNPVKCPFGVKSGKLLGFVVSEKGIEVDPDKADSLKYLLGSPSSMRNVAKWRCQLTEYDIEYISRTSVKGQTIADHLVEFPIKDDTPINSDFPDERILQVSDEEETLGWKVYFDGAVNSTGFGIGAVLISPEGRHFPVAAKIDFPCTNNIAEYEAFILGLQAAIDLKSRS
ncbi:hypothetical protein CRG98_013912 [Punica granatum]|uniref:RNase H type-1 domain-containing protein n=1 Tax=Punica granatum TaxID=22663 RepID=A0A2I0KAX8_PUNGR|nr:hypothetical protein CRG98_013912 [Punica granatum]